MVDPLTTIGVAISASLYAYAPLAKAIRVGNRVALYHDIYRPAKPEIAPSDVELELSQRGFRLAPFKGNSLAGEFAIQYPVMVSVPSKQRFELDEANRLVWLICCSLVAGPEKFGLPNLVRDWEIQDGEGFRISPQSEWSALAIISVAFSVRTSEMILFDPDK